MAISVPTGIKIFNWLGTMWGGKIQFKTPMLFCIGFLFQFLIAGLTGIMLAAAPFDWQLAGSYFLVAHFHYVIVGAILFAIFAAFYYWFPKMSGKMLLGNSGQVAFLVVPHRVPLDLRLHACPRIAGNAPQNLYLRTRARLGDMESDRNYRRCLSGFGSSGFRLQPAVGPISAARLPGTIPGTRGLWNGPQVHRPPLTISPTIPTVKSRRPLWDLKHPEDPDWKYE